MAAHLVVEGGAASRAGVAAEGVGRVVHDPLVDEEAAAQLEQLSAGGADVAVVAVRRRKVRLVVVQGAARGELQGWMDAWLFRPLALIFEQRSDGQRFKFPVPFQT